MHQEEFYIAGTMNSLVGAVTLVSVERFKQSKASIWHQ